MAARRAPVPPTGAAARRRSVRRPRARDRTGAEGRGADGVRRAARRLRRSATQLRIRSDRVARRDRHPRLRLRLAARCRPADRRPRCIGLAIGLSGITLLAAVTDVGTAAPELATMIGLGVGIDYSLFIVTRHRENLAAGMDVEPAVGRAVATAGQAVLFAGTTVVIAICGLLISGIPYVAVLGFSAAIVVAVMMIAVDHAAARRCSASSATRIARGRRASSRPRAARAFWERWATIVARHPWPFAVVAVLVPAHAGRAVPLDPLRPGGRRHRAGREHPTDGVRPDRRELRPRCQRPARRRRDLRRRGSGAEHAPRRAEGDPRRRGRSHRRRRTPPTTLRSSRSNRRLRPTRKRRRISSRRCATTSSRRRSRARAASRAYVGGITAAYIDVGQRIADRLPYFIGAVVLLSFLLLMVVFRSDRHPGDRGRHEPALGRRGVRRHRGRVPVGMGEGLFGLDSTIPIISFVPMMMFAVLFGLSMDYQVFLLTRVREEYDKTGETRTAVVTGLSHTARVDHVGGLDHDRRLPELRRLPDPRGEDVRARPGRRGRGRLHGRAGWCSSPASWRSSARRTGGSRAGSRASSRRSPSSDSAVLDAQADALVPLALRLGLHDRDPPDLARSSARACRHRPACRARRCRRRGSPPPTRG